MSTTHGYNIAAIRENGCTTSTQLWDATLVDCLDEVLRWVNQPNSGFTAQCPVVIAQHGGPTLYTTVEHATAGTHLPPRLPDHPDVDRDPDDDPEPYVCELCGHTSDDWTPHPHHDASAEELAAQMQADEQHGLQVDVTRQARPVAPPSGWEDYHTGGGCTAWRLQLPAGYYALITQPMGADSPTSYEGDVLLGIYAEGGSEAVLDYHGSLWAAVEVAETWDPASQLAASLPGSAVTAAPMEVGKAIGCYDCDQTFDNVDALLAHERATGHGKEAV